MPIFLLIQGLGQDQGKAGPGIATLRESAAFVPAWLGYAELWPLFAVLWNWCHLVQYLLMACAMALGIAALRLTAG